MPSATDRVCELPHEPGVMRFTHWDSHVSGSAVLQAIGEALLQAIGEALFQAIGERCSRRSASAVLGEVEPGRLGRGQLDVERTQAVV